MSGRRGVSFHIPEPCEERWEDMAPRGEGRFCERCQHTVVDLSKMSRAQAESRMRRVTGDYLCVQLAVDEDDAALFRPAPSRAPHWAGGLVLLSALSAAGCAEGDAPEMTETIEPCELPDPGPAMQPVVTQPAPEAVPEAVAMPSDAGAGALSAAEREALEARKHAIQNPPIRMVRGRMPRHRF